MNGNPQENMENMCKKASKTGFFGALTFCNETFHATAGNRTLVKCLEGSYDNHYTTNAIPVLRRLGHITTSVQFCGTVVEKAILPGKASCVCTAGHNGSGGI